MLIIAINNKKLILKNCHNNIIQSHHYRTQSNEYLCGVKEIRGGGVHKKKYINFSNHKKNIYNYKCNLLKNKRKNMIEKIIKLSPKIYSNSSFYLNSKVIKLNKKFGIFNSLQIISHYLNNLKENQHLIILNNEKDSFIKEFYNLFNKIKNLHFTDSIDLPLIFDSEKDSIDISNNNYTILNPLPFIYKKL